MTKTAIQKSTIRPQEIRDLSHQMLGAAKYATVLHKQTASDLIRFLIMVRDEKRYLDYDCQNFDEFLNSGHSPISHTTFYRQLELFKKEGDLYDILENWQIPARWRRQLTDGDFSFDGDAVVIGEHRVPMSEETVIRQAFETLVRERIETRKKIGRLEDLKRKYEKLKAEAEAADGKHPYQVAYLHVIEGLMILIAEVKGLPGDMKGERGEADTNQIMGLMEQLYDAYGEQMPWDRGSWLRKEPVDLSAPYFQSDAIDGDNF